MACPNPPLPPVISAIFPSRENKESSVTFSLPAGMGGEETPHDLRRAAHAGEIRPLIAHPDHGVQLDLRTTLAAGVAHGAGDGAIQEDARSARALVAVCPRARPGGNIGRMVQAAAMVGDTHVRGPMKGDHSDRV